MTDLAFKPLEFNPDTATFVFNFFTKHVRINEKIVATGLWDDYDDWFGWNYFLLKNHDKDYKFYYDDNLMIAVYKDMDFIINPISENWQDSVDKVFETFKIDGYIPLQIVDKLNWNSLLKGNIRPSYAYEPKILYNMNKKELKRKKSGINRYKNSKNFETIVSDCIVPDSYREKLLELLEKWQKEKQDRVSEGIDVCDDYYKIMFEDKLASYIFKFKSFIIRDISVDKIIGYFLLCDVTGDGNRPCNLIFLQDSSYKYISSWILYEVGRYYTMTNKDCRFIDVGPAFIEFNEKEDLNLKRFKQEYGSIEGTRYSALVSYEKWKEFKNKL